MGRLELEEGDVPGRGQAEVRRLRRQDDGEARRPGLDEVREMSR